MLDRKLFSGEDTLALHRRQNGQPDARRLLFQPMKDNAVPRYGDRICLSMSLIAALGAKTANTSPPGGSVRSHAQVGGQGSACSPSRRNSPSLEARSSEGDTRSTTIPYMCEANMRTALDEYGNDHSREHGRTSALGDPNGVHGISTGSSWTGEYRPSHPGARSRHGIRPWHGT